MFRPIAAISDGAGAVLGYLKESIDTLAPQPT